MIGIYKITSPTGRIYIGQSVNIEKRLKSYKALNCKTQTKLYKSLKKYGYKNHLFEIICKCESVELNNKERYYQDYYNSVSENNLNCLATISDTKSGYMSNESKLKMSDSRKGVKRTNNLIERLREINTGSKRSNESKEKMRLAQTGKKRTLESRLKQSEKMKGRFPSIETIIKMKIVEKTAEKFNA